MGEVLFKVKYLIFYFVSLRSHSFFLIGSFIFRINSLTCFYLLGFFIFKIVCKLFALYYSLLLLCVKHYNYGKFNRQVIGSNKY